MFTINACVPASFAIAALVGVGVACIEVRESPDGAASAPRVAANRSEIVAITWNLNWFQDREHGPADDARQFAEVRDILEGTRADLIALQEVASEAGFEGLRDQLHGYDGVLARYDAPQKTALLWRTELFELRKSRSLTGLRDAGRPPLEVGLQALGGGAELLVCVVHAKAETSASSYAQRLEFARGLKAHFDLDQTGQNAAQLVVIGDYNDLLIGSLSPGEPSPYRAFIEDLTYAAPTLVLNREDRAGETSYAWGATVDHVIVRNQRAGDAGDAGSQAIVLRDELLADIPDFVSAVSDHFPVRVGLPW
jgi:endonuclease/exonuclease/phosphatase family metal-dependent hydrolase